MQPAAALEALAEYRTPSGRIRRSLAVVLGDLVYS